jgi:hypothetical protein
MVAGRDSRASSPDGSVEVLIDVHSVCGVSRDRQGRWT